MRKLFFLDILPTMIWTFFPFSYQCEKCPKDNGERKKGVKIQIKAKVVFELSKRKTSRILSEFFSRPNEMEDEEN